MPVNNPSPNFALLSSFNARTWSGTNIFDRGATNISLPTFSTGEGIYEDVISLLNGRGSQSGMSASDFLQTSSAFGSSWTVSIDSNDKVKIECSDAFKVRYVSGGDVLGVGSSFSTVSTSFTSPNDWTRGNVDGGRYEFRDSADSNSFSYFVKNSVLVQDLIVAIRERGTTSDVDDVNATNCIEYLDIIATGSSDIGWILNDDGHVECEYDSSVGDITWISTTFRDRLGFSGNETPTGTTRKKIVADYPCPGTLYPSRPYQSHHLQTDTVAQARRKIGGGYVSNFIGSYVKSILGFDLDALLDEIDLYRHFTNNFVQYVPTGERINFYQNVGDSRRALITSGITSTQPAYDLLYTSEDNGNTGRIRASILDNGSINLAYPNRLKRRVPVAMTLEHL